MARVHRKKIKERAVKMNDAWQQGAPSKKFKNIGQSNLEDKMTAIAAKEAARDDLKAQAALMDEEVKDLYAELDGMMVDVRNGVIGDDDFGDDCPLYGEMGYVRKSERASGLTHKKKDDAKNENEN